MLDKLYSRMRPLRSARWIVVSILATWGSGFSHLYASETPPNFILILTDDHGWTSTSTKMDAARKDSGSEFHETPHIDRVAAQGMRFSQGYSPAAICTPARRSILFGQTHFRMGPDDGFEERYHPYQKAYLTIPLMLKQTNARYRAAHFGKWHQKTGDFSPEDFGFDQSDGRTSNGDGSIWENKEDKWKKTFLVDAPKGIDRLSGRGASFMRRNVASGNPFFLQISHYATHVDIQTKPETYARFSGKLRGRTHDHPGYAAMLADLDSGIGAILDEVESLGISDNTYILIMADNGGAEFIPPVSNKLAPPGTNGRPSRNDPLRGGKWVLYEGGVRVPFIVAGPGVLAKSQSDVPVIGYDLLPTIAELAGFAGAMPDYVDGGSFVALLDDGEGEVLRPSDALFHHRYASYLHSSIRVGDYKLLKFWADHPNHREGIELYDLSQDLGETTDLAERMPAKAKALETQLLDYIEAVDGNVAGDLN
ncbi:MAG: sulfatase [Opitutaceae bacterium]|nr:sulfatase [Opitutaceae bacterium]